MHHTNAPDSGTKDQNYDLITVTQLCLEHVWRLEQYASDAERGGDEELSSLFRRMQEHSRRGAEASKRLLQQRLGEERHRYGDGRGRRVRPVGALESGPYYGAPYGYELEQRPLGPGTGWGQERTYGESGYRGDPTSYGGRFAGHGPKGYTRSPERIVEAVSERLTDHPDLDASQIEVDVKDEVVVLHGRVRDRGQKRAAEDVAATVSGVRDVRNELDVDKSMFQELADAITGRSEEPATTRSSRDPAGV